MKEKENIGFPYDYGDGLSYAESKKNFLELTKNITPVVLSALVIGVSFAHAADKPTPAPGTSGVGAPTRNPAMQSAKNLIVSKPAMATGATIVCVNAIATGNVPLALACGIIIAVMTGG
jgi:hypothetical protein